MVFVRREREKLDISIRKTVLWLDLLCGACLICMCFTSKEEKKGFIMDWFCLVLGLVWRDVVLSLMTLTNVVMLNAYVSLV